MIVDRLEDSLNGCYSGLYGEVVTMDSYRLKDINYPIDLVIDMGGNVGIFARFAREVFPKAFVVSVEPNIDNQEVFEKFTSDRNIHLVKKAIGRGKTWHKTDATNGSNEEYLSLSDHISEEDMINNSRAELSDVELIMPDELISNWAKPDDNILIKIDIEGNENTIWEHQDSLEAISRADYIVAEIHPHAFTGIERDKAKQNLMDAIEFLKKTHEVEYEHIYLFAKKRMRWESTLG